MNYKYPVRALASLLVLGLIQGSCSKQEEALAPQTETTKATDTPTDPKTPETEKEPQEEEKQPQEEERYTLVLTADKQSLIADGKDKVLLSLTCNGEQVQEGYRYIINGEPYTLVGGAFTTEKAGDYDIYILYKEQHQSNTLRITAQAVITPPKPQPEVEQPTPAPTPQYGREVILGKAGTIFAHGVSRESGWYDVNKKGDGRGSDGLMCWAAAASTALQWWQDVYVRAGNKLPEGIASGVGTEYELRIFELFKSNWDNLGATSSIGCHWYFTGENRGANAVGYARPKPNSGAYLRQVYDRIIDRWGSDFSEETKGYRTWDTGSPDQSKPAIEVFSRLILKALQEGVVILDVNPGYSGAHAITLWGCEYNEQGIITKMYITDSDDLIRTPREPRRPILHEFELAPSPSARETRVVGLRGMSYKPFVQIQNFETLRAFPH